MMIFRSSHPVEVMSSAVMGSTPPYFSDFDSDHDLSTGYLEDALLEFGDRSKRRRLSFCGEDRTAKEFDDHALVRNFIVPRVEGRKIDWFQFITLVDSFWAGLLELDLRMGCRRELQWRQ